MEKKIFGFLTEASKNGYTKKDLVKIVKVKPKVFKYNEKPFDWLKFRNLLSIVTLLFAIQNQHSYGEQSNSFTDLISKYVFSLRDPCLYAHSSLSVLLTRPIANCSFCTKVNEIDVISNISKDYFEKHYAYTGVPVLIKGEAKHWPAYKLFEFEFFKKLYKNEDIFEEYEMLGCQFFPFKTSFKTLRSVFQMSKKRHHMLKDGWYVGWSNCVPRVSQVLRKLYNRPSFLSEDSESSQLDWMFMGGGGMGALMHLDTVNRPSWHALLKGKKKWFLEPFPECEKECHRHLSVTMEPGDIFVVDTNLWYHSTYIYPGEMSIAIGSEYD